MAKKTRKGLRGFHDKKITLMEQSQLKTGTFQVLYSTHSNIKETL